MLLKTTTGREFELDTNSSSFHQSRFLISQLIDNGAYDNILTDEAIFEDVVSTLNSHNHYEEGRVRIVLRNYFDSLKPLLLTEKIDKSDFLTLLGKLTMEELSGLR